MALYFLHAFLVLPGKVQITAPTIHKLGVVLVRVLILIDVCVMCKPILLGELYFGSCIWSCKCINCSSRNTLA
ncbi:hypothetical protein XENTR_v10016948 [Xenopus tropicalis]|nr:hypothetical protein XENTR_v10016948 [Xenopus tropicalis]